MTGLPTPAALAARLQGHVTVLGAAPAAEDLRLHHRDAATARYHTGASLGLVVTVVVHPAALRRPLAEEAALLARARDAGVAVPEVVLVDAEPAAALLVTRRVAGRARPAAVLAAVREAGNGEQVVRQLGWALGAWHRVDPGQLPIGPVPSEHPARDAVAAARQAVADLPQPSPAFALGLRWLERHLPAPPARLTPLHGDARTGHLVVGEDGLRALLGWQRAGLGDPMADLARTCLRCFRHGHDDAEVGGIWSRGALVEGYQDAGGAFDLERFHWWKVFGTLERGIEHASLPPVPAASLPLARAVAGRRVAEQEYDLLTLLG